jgi:hypothetical protein
MRLMKITRLVAVSMVLLSATPAFAAREIHRDAREFCSEQNAEFCTRSPVNAQIPGISFASPAATRNSQAAENAASKTWPGDMIVN